MTSAFDHPAAGRTVSGQSRFAGLDVTRAVALIGVVVMNYHGMLTFSEGFERDETPSFLERMFDIGTGVLSTRFAGVFVLVAGIGVTLLTDSARRGASKAALAQARLRLVRRGTALLLAGYFLDMAWPGTILFHYGAFFIISALVFAWRTRTLAIVAAAILPATLALSTWRRIRSMEGDPTDWVDPSNISSLQDFAARVFLGYTHPFLPWFAFLLIGMMIGRYLKEIRARTRSICIVLIVAIAGVYGAATALRSFDIEDHAVLYILSSMHPDERGLAYALATSSIAALAFVSISWAAERAGSSRLIVVLQRAGQLSLTLYLGHVLFYYAVVRWAGWDIGSGLSSALMLATVYWILAIAVGSWWHHRIGSGPAERLYRWLGG